MNATLLSDLPTTSLRAGGNRTVQRTRRRVGQFLPRPLAPVSAGSSAVKELQQEEEISRLRVEIQELRSTIANLQQGAQHHLALPVSQIKRKLTQDDYNVLPHRIILLRHAESLGNVDKNTYCNVPDHTVPLTDRGRQQALTVGQHIRSTLDAQHGQQEYKVFFMTSPYRRTMETTDMLLNSWDESQVIGVREAVQLRECDFGNLQDAKKMSKDLKDRDMFGRFWFRFPNGESGADVYDRITQFEDHLTRDMLMGRYQDANLILVTHGLTLRIFLMRWFHWSVADYLQIYNPENCDPIIVEKLPWQDVQELQRKKYAHVKHCYAIKKECMPKLRGLRPDMLSYLPRKDPTVGSKARWFAGRVSCTPPPEAPAGAAAQGGATPGHSPSPGRSDSEGPAALRTEDQAARALGAQASRDGAGSGQDSPTPSRSHTYTYGHTAGAAAAAAAILAAGSADEEADAEGRSPGHESGSEREHWGFLEEAEGDGGICISCVD